MSVERKNTFILILFNFFLGLGYTTGYFSSNSLFVHHVGAESLPQVYLASALLSLLVSGIFHLLIGRLRRRPLIHASFFILGGIILMSWFLLVSIPPSRGSITAYASSFTWCSSSPISSSG